MAEQSTSLGGIGFVDMLTIVFIVLKLCDVIAWSWWWVLSPLWIMALVLVGILSVGGVIIMAAAKRGPPTTTRTRK